MFSRTWQRLSSVVLGSLTVPTAGAFRLAYMFPNFCNILYSPFRPNLFIFHISKYGLKFRQHLRAHN